jgi:RNA polymerase sigma-70 factor (ECF subfamily)
MSVVAAFLESAEPQVQRTLGAEPALEAWLMSRHSQAAAAHGTTVPGPDAFAAYLGARLKKVEGLGSLEPLVTEDLYLCCAALAKEETALRKLDAAISATRSAVARIHPDPAFIDEVLQLVRTRLILGNGEGEERNAPRLLRYEGRGPLGAWLRTVAIGTALNHRRAEGLTAPAGDLAVADAQARSMGGELQLVRSQYRKDFEDAFHLSFAELTSRERNLLRMRFIDGLSAEQIARFYRVHRTSAARWLDAAREKLLGATRRALHHRLRLTDSELDSLLRAFQEDLELSIVSLLKTPG